jgi:uncharacterized repeat protein (TIGR01451 family)
MIRLSPHRIAPLLVVMSVILSLTGLDFGSGLAAESPGGQNLGQGSWVVVPAGHGDTLTRVPPPKTFSEPRIQSATINVTFLEAGEEIWGYSCSAWPSEASAAFQHAVSIWESLITSPVPIEVEACWADLGSALGTAGAADVQSNFAGAPFSETWYPNALANKLAGLDLDATKHDIDALFNSNRTDWYFGTDGHTPLDEYDFVTAALQQLGHGLGFVGSMNVSGSVGSWGGGTDYPYIYDRFTENGSGSSLINDFPNNSEALAEQLQSTNVFFDGPNTRLANDGSRAKLYAPTTWVPGSSYNHLDDLTYDGTENALMAPSLAQGEVNHHPGPITLGIFQDLGWDTVQIAPDLTIAKQMIGDPLISPGDVVTFTLSIINTGAATAGGVIVTDTLPAEILMPSTVNTFGVTPRGGTTYVWDLPDLSPTASGVITIYGTISSTLPSDYAIWNTATISTEDDESSTSNNSSTALVGGNRVFMPLVLKNQ